VPVTIVKILPLLILFYSQISSANYVNGYGEFFYGPDTSDNVACEYALDRSKQDAIQNHLGVEIESFTTENCRTENDCAINVDTYIQMFGKINQIVKKDIKKYEEHGRKVCRAEITAVVERILNNTNFSVKGKTNYIESEELEFSIISNAIGYVSVYNYYNDQYVKIYETKITDVNVEYKIKKEKEKIVAVLPKNQYKSNELLIFLFSKEKPMSKKQYGQFEFGNILSTLDSNVKRTIFRFITIGKKL
jgi:hypothetical protein